jgi:hypothetical protein
MSVNTNIIGDSKQTDRIFFYTTSSGKFQVSTVDESGIVSSTNVDQLTDISKIAFMTTEQTTSGLWSFKSNNKYFDGSLFKSSPTFFEISYPSNVNSGDLLLLGLKTTMTAVINGNPRSGTPFVSTLGGTQLYTQAGGRCSAPYSPYEFLQMIQSDPNAKFYTDTGLCGAGMDISYCTNPIECGTVKDGKTCYAPCIGNKLCTNESAVMKGNGYIGCSSSMSEELIDRFNDGITYIFIFLGLIIALFLFGFVLYKTREASGPTPW